MFRAAAWVTRAVGSGWFFYATVVVFTASALAIALTSRRELYDEYWHIDIIQIFSTDWTPFISHQPADSGAAGDVVRTGSYLYHYLLSWPYRWLMAAGASDTEMLITLRVITLIAPVASLFWFRRILRDVGVTAGVINTAILMYCAVPISSFVAATINYDNLVQLIGAIILSMALRLWMDPRRSVGYYAAFLGIGALGCVTKFEFAPVFAAAIVVVAVRYLLAVRKERSWALPLPFATAGQRARQIAALAVFVLGVALVVERYVVNIVVYRAIVPACTALHSQAFCHQYLVEARNDAYAAAHPQTTAISPTVLLGYIWDWIGGTIGTLPTVGTEVGNGKGAPITLWLLQSGAAIAALIFLIAIAKILAKPGFAVLAVITAVYGAALFENNFGFYLKYGVPATIQARYWLLFLPIMLAAVGYGLREIFHALYGRHAVLPQAITLVVLLLAITQGGFFTTFMVAAGPNWFLADGPLHDSLLPLLRGFAKHLVTQRSLP